MDGSAVAFCQTAGAPDPGEFFGAHGHQPHRLLPRFGGPLGEDPDKPAGVHDHQGLSGAPGEARLDAGLRELR